MNPDVAKGNLGEAAGRTTAKLFGRILGELLKVEEERDKEPLVGSFFRFFSEAEAHNDLDNQETFTQGCREYEDKIEETADAQEREALAQDFAAYKKEWEKQARREREDREFRDKRIAMWRDRFKI